MTTVHYSNTIAHTFCDVTLASDCLRHHLVIHSCSSALCILGKLLSNPSKWLHVRNHMKAPHYGEHHLHAAPIVEIFKSFVYTALITIIL